MLYSPVNGQDVGVEMEGPSRLRKALTHDAVATWHCAASLHPNHLIYPVFISAQDPDACVPIDELPGLCRWGSRRIVDHLKPLVALGLRAVLLFGEPHKDSVKSKDGAVAGIAHGPVHMALRTLRSELPTLLLIADVCLCAYTIHGHCGVPQHPPWNDRLDYWKSNEVLARVACSYAEAGAHVLAPSDMLDGHVVAIRRALNGTPYESLPVMAYSAKFASSFYGPFRAATGCALTGKNDAETATAAAAAQKPKVPALPPSRRAYQLPPGSRDLAMLALARDIAEGAEMLIVKPAGSYLDIVRAAAERYPDTPIAAYQVSGEYAMLFHGARAGAFELRDAVLESLTACLRAGARMVITYYTPQTLRWLSRQVGEEMTERD